MGKSYKGYMVLLVTLLSCIALMCGCRGSSTDDNGEDNETDGNSMLKVVTTLYASYDFVREIAGDNVELTMLLKPGEESHSYEPTPKDIITIQECDLFIYNGGENDTWVDQVLESVNGVKFLKMMDCVSELREEQIVDGMYERGHGDHHGHGGEDGDNGHDGHGHDGHGDETHEEENHEEENHEEAEYDEHIWTSPVNAISIAEAIAGELGTLDPGNSDTYRNNCKRYVSELKELDDSFRQIVRNAKRNLVIFGDRFPLMYFVGEYGIDYYAAFPGCSAETEPSVATMTFLIDKVNENNIPVVFKTELSNDNIARIISEETGAGVRTFYACHNVSADDFRRGFSYIDMMRENAVVLKEALD